MAPFRALILLAFALAAGCGGSEDQQQAASTEPIVGVLELPLSHRNNAPAPTEAYRVEIAPSEVRLDGRTVLPLEGARVPQSERAGDVLTKLGAAISGGPARARAAIRMHVNTPWETTIFVLRTLERANVRSISFEVRKPGTTSDTGWLTLESWKVLPPGTAPTFDPQFVRPWGDFTSQWLAAYDACRGAEYVDCDTVPVVPAPGGEVLVTLRSRGSAVKIEFTRVNGPPIPEGPARPQMIEGVPAPQPGEEQLPPPVTEAVFALRAESTTAADSDVAGVTRPLCGQRPCGVQMVADPETLSMRMLSLLGATFPDGAPAPSVVFQLP